MIALVDNKPTNIEQLPKDSKRIQLFTIPRDYDLIQLLELFPQLEVIDLSQVVDYYEKLADYGDMANNLGTDKEGNLIHIGKFFAKDMEESEIDPNHFTGYIGDIFEEITLDTFYGSEREKRINLMTDQISKYFNIKNLTDLERELNILAKKIPVIMTEKGIYYKGEYISYKYTIRRKNIIIVEHINGNIHCYHENEIANIVDATKITLNIMTIGSKKKTISKAIELCNTVLKNNYDTVVELYINMQDIVITVIYPYKSYIKDNDYGEMYLDPEILAKCPKLKRVYCKPCDIIHPETVISSLKFYTIEYPQNLKLHKDKEEKLSKFFDNLPKMPNLIEIHDPVGKIPIESLGENIKKYEGDAYELLCKQKSKDFTKNLDTLALNDYYFPYNKYGTDYFHDLLKNIKNLIIRFMECSKISEAYGKEFDNIFRNSSQLNFEEVKFTFSNWSFSGLLSAMYLNRKVFLDNPDLKRITLTDVLDHKKVLNSCNPIKPEDLSEGYGMGFKNLKIPPGFADIYHIHYLYDTLILERKE